MKRLSLLLFALLLAVPLRAADPPTEGMWIPLLLEELNYGEMREMGLELNPEDIYSVNQGSLKDAVVSFGGFCTGAVVSEEGLVLTNHHCGYRRIQSHSSVENDYLKEGFWAMDRSEELLNPGLTCTFIRRIEDVTEEVAANLEDDMSPEEREAAIELASSKLIAEATADSHYGAKVKAFYEGNKFYLFVTETFKDIRLVGAPPSAIGKFGGDTDNWMWPRHTGDFSVFRIYAGPDNKPAEYAEENVPYEPRKAFDVSLAGIEESDFTMAFGFPGRTEEYLTSWAVEQRQNLINPIRIGLRGKRIEVMNRYMDQSDELRIMYAAKQSGVSNGWKKWIGQNRGLKRLDAIEKKQQMEDDFRAWVSASDARKSAYGHLLPEFKRLYDELRDYEKAYQYFLEGYYQVEAVKFAMGFSSLLGQEDIGEAKRDSIAAELRTKAETFFAGWHKPLDQEIAAIIWEEYDQNLDRNQYQPRMMAEAFSGDYAGNYEGFAENLYAQSAFTNPDRMDALLANPKKAVRELREDPIWKLANQGLMIFRTQIAAKHREIIAQIDLLERPWVKGILEKDKGKKRHFPDANSTLRLTYGTVGGYRPYDAVIYEHQTTMDGVMLKEQPNDREFHVPQKLKDLYKEEDFGDYANADGTMPVCFIASNHTSGGNSGSPVMNGRGQLIGLNFDRNWEGTMSDIIYDKSLVRNITVDIRYVLFIMDKYAGATHLVDEMKLVD